VLVLDKRDDIRVVFTDLDMPGRLTASNSLSTSRITITA
jgi:hypothetical protein